MRKTILIILTGLALTLPGGAAIAEGGKKPAGPPPMLVTTAEIVNGEAAPTANFIGTIYYARTAEVAAEIEGIVSQVYIDDGRPVKTGDRLARLDDGLLATEIDGTEAVYEQNLIELEQAQRDYDRIGALHQQDSIATSEYEAYGTRVNRLKKQSSLLKARRDRMLLEKKKKTVRAPFDGVIIENLVEAGEWVKAGGIIASLADNHNMEMRVDITANIIANLTPGQEFMVKVAGQELPGKFMAIIPRGDITTRTFVAKFILADGTSLIEGMQAQVTLPSASISESLLVPRDAVINNSGDNFVFINNNGIAKKISVEVTGHSGNKVGISSADAEAGQMVIVKGNERIRDGRPVRTE